MARAVARRRRRARMSSGRSVFGGRPGGAAEGGARQMALGTLDPAPFLELSKRPRARRGGGYVHDFRVAARQLIGTPVVTAIAVVSLALGIGANTAIFSLVNSLSLRTLPVKDPQRLAMLTDDSPQGED